MATRLLPGMVQSSRVKSLTISFRSENVMFSEIMMSLQGNSLQNWGFPTIFGRFRLIKCIPITKLNVTIPVLFKTSFKYRFHPPCPPLPHPPWPNPSCPHLLAPVPQPLPQEFGPPLSKVNQQLKIVNYFTCMRHFFCRW